MSPELDPNRIFDAEALKKPLGGLLERSWRLLEPKKVTLEASWSRLGGLTPIDGRWAGGQQEVKEAPFAGHGPWGAPLSKITC